MRAVDGSVNEDLRAQKSAHIVAGFTYDFLWGKHRPVKMRLITEAYYKSMWVSLVSYDLDNVRVRYSGLNDSRGYATGLDIRLNGEFVPGAESYDQPLFPAHPRVDRQHSAQDQKTRRLAGTRRKRRAAADRPAGDHVYVFSGLPAQKPEHADTPFNFTVEYRLPFGIPDNNVIYRNPYRFAPYHRVDIGFGFLLWKQEWRNRRPNHFLRFTRNTWASFEVFNLLKVANEASNTWIKAITNVQYAIPNYLTGRRINLRLKMDF